MLTRGEGVLIIINNAVFLGSLKKAELLIDLEFRWGAYYFATTWMAEAEAAKATALSILKSNGLLL